MAAGAHHTLALREDGMVVAWGHDGKGQTNVPAGRQDVVAIAAGLSHSVALRPDGTLVMWGTSADGELESRILAGRVGTVAAGTGFTLALTPGPTITSQPADSGRYRFVMRTVAGEVASEEFVVVVDPATPVDHVGRAPVLEAGDGRGTVRAWQWFHNGTAIPNATNSAWRIERLRPDDAGDYTVRLTDAGGDRSVPAAQVTVADLKLVFRTDSIGGGITWRGSPARLVEHVPADIPPPDRE